MIDAAKVMAQWRREGHGIWYVTFIVEGYDDEFTHLVPGSLSQANAVGLARMQCAAEMKENKQYIHLVKAEKKT